MNASEAIRLERVLHRGERRLLLHFDGQSGWLAKVKGLSMARYSRTHHRYHIPATKAAYQALLSLQIPIVTPSAKPSKDQVKRIQISSGTAQGQLADQQTTAIETSSRPPLPTSPSSQEEGDIPITVSVGAIKVTYTGKYFLIKTPYDVTTINKIKQLKKAYWNPNNRIWLVLAVYETMVAIQTWLECWSPAHYGTIEAAIDKYDRPTTITLYQLPDKPQDLLIEVAGRRKVLGPVMRYRHVELPNRPDTYAVGYHRNVVEQITADYNELGIKVINRTLRQEEDVPAEDNLGIYLDRLVSKLSPRQRKLAKGMGRSLIRSRMSRRTVRAYIGALLKFDTWLQEHRHLTVTQQVVNKYLTEKASSDLSDSSIHRIVSTLKYYFKNVSKNREIKVEAIKRPKKARRLPKIISSGSVLRMIESTSNHKHKNILAALYASGLRVSELCRLKLADILWDRQQIIVRGGKGKKDRSIILSEWLCELLQDYFHEYKPVSYLFESTTPGKPYSTSSVQAIVRDAKRKGGISQRVTPHILRHSYATHLHDEGIDIAYIQKLLGHKSIRTTMIYTHISTTKAASIRSPLDNLRDQKVGK